MILCSSSSPACELSADRDMGEGGRQRGHNCDEQSLSFGDCCRSRDIEKSPC
jgi:hypothetical protein